MSASRRIFGAAFWLLAVLIAPAECAGLEPAAPGPVIVPGVNDAGWSGLFRSLASQGAVRSTFTERRWFSFRKEPVVLRGELRRAPGRGLSLRYTEPRAYLLILDSRGILLRDSRGRTRSLPHASQAFQIEAMLRPVLQFDFARLQAEFEVHAARNGGDWRLDFVPRTREIAARLKVLTVTGSGSSVRRLEFRHTANERVVVDIDHADIHLAFGAAELKRYFR